MVRSFYRHGMDKTALMAFIPAKCLHDVVIFKGITTARGGTLVLHRSSMPAGLLGGTAPLTARMAECTSTHPTRISGT